MKPKLKNIAIVPARIGSKRIKEKILNCFMESQLLFGH